MIFLTATDEVLQLTLVQAISTDITVGWIDHSDTGAVPDTNQLNTSTAGSTEIVSSPASGEQRQIKFLSVRNGHASTTQTVVIQKDDGTAFDLTSDVELLAGETLQYIDSIGFKVFDDNGVEKQKDPTVATELSDLTDVGSSVPTNRNALVADGALFTSRSLVEADISDLGSYADAVHTHVEADITDLGNYSVVGHTHTESDITDLGNYLETVTASDVDAEASTDGWVLTSDGAGNAAWEVAAVGGIQDVVDDTSPQLGGNLDVNGSSIVSISNADINITPNGTGNIALGTLTFDGDQTVGALQDNQALKYNDATGLIEFGVALAEVEEDSNPKLGGDLIVNGNSIISETSGDISITPNGTGNVHLGNMSFDSDAPIGSGQDQYVLTYGDSSGLIELQAVPSSISYPLTAPDGSESAPSYSFSSQSGTGMYRLSFGDVAFTEAGTLAGTIGTTGFMLYGGYIRMNAGAAQSGSDWRCTIQTPNNMTANQFLKLPSNGASDNTVLLGDGTGTFGDQCKFAQLTASYIDAESSTDGWVLTSDGAGNAAWEAVAGGGASELSDLSDVNTSTPTNRFALIADGTDFESRAITEADISDLGSYGTMSDVVDDTTPQLGGDLDGQGNEISDVTLPLTINTQTGTTYGPVLTDSEKMITLNNASAITATIPANASVAYPVGTKLNFMQLGAGQVTIAITTDTLNVDADLTLKLNGQYAVATAFKVTTTSWVLFGNLEPA